MTCTIKGEGREKTNQGIFQRAEMRVRYWNDKDDEGDPLYIVRYIIHHSKDLIVIRISDPELIGGMYFSTPKGYNYPRLKKSEIEKMFVKSNYASEQLLDLYVKEHGEYDDREEKICYLR